MNDRRSNSQRSCNHPDGAARRHEASKSSSSLFQTSIAPSSFTPVLAGGMTPSSSTATISGSCSSRRPARGPRSIFGKGVTAAAPGSAQGFYLVVSDIEAARKPSCIDRGVEVSEMFHHAGGAHTGPDEPYLFGSVRVSGLDPERRTYHSYATFRDPDGNAWLLQEVTARLPGRVDANETTFASVADLASAFRRAEAAHGEHEKRTGVRDANWADWYAEYLVAEQAGKELPQ